MTSRGKPAGNRHRAAIAAAMLCAWSAPAMAQPGWTAVELLTPDSVTLQAEPFSVLSASRSGGLSFDLGDSERQKLQLRLAEPLLLPPEFLGEAAGLLTSGSTITSSLAWNAGDDLAVELNASRTTLASPFEPLGSIHCENGILAPDSYTASGCYFVDQGAGPRLGSMSLGARYTLGSNASAGFNLFRNDLSAGVGAAPLPGGNESIALSRLLTGQPLPLLDSEMTGIDLQFQVGISTDRAGDIRLGLQLTRVLDVEQQTGLAAHTGIGGWVLDGPSDSARVSFDWQKGSFSGGVQSFYRAPIEFMNRNEADSLTTFDVHFTWRTPWNANLSVGASNVLNAGTDENSAQEKLADPFESVYGRIPYVRYKQDL